MTAANPAVKLTWQRLFADGVRLCASESGPGAARRAGGPAGGLPVEQPGVVLGGPGAQPGMAAGGPLVG